MVELVAEAVKVAVDELEDVYPDYPWHQPIEMRNILAHEYWRTDPELVRAALAEDIPDVAQKVRKLIGDQGDSGRLVTTV
ncbi:MAG: DUF86 domain-containing protein [Actinomycetota bacterium]|nr:DUF86 domain-containing protein [Actinomycetota bacterium]